MEPIKELVAKARDPKVRGTPESEKLLLRASAVCHIGRYPVINSPLRHEIWEIQKDAYFEAASHWADPTKDMKIPHKHALVSRGDKTELPFAYRYPASTKAGNGPVPVIVMLSGLDGFRVDHPHNHFTYFNEHGWAYVCVEVPGGGDCPGARNDPESPDRIMSTILDWIDEQPELDSNNICSWGYSTGGYYSLRAAHTHASRLRGVVAQGLFCHHAFDEEWLEIMDQGEFFAELTKSLLIKFDYPSLEEMKRDAKKRFSLVENGILDMPCTRLLMLNGMDDTIYPIEDTMLVMNYPGPKEVRAFEGRPHMGEPQGGPIGFEWLRKLLYASSAAPAATS